jgi:hypothetical protein
LLRHSLLFLSVIVINYSLVAKINKQPEQTEKSSRAIAMLSHKKFDTITRNSSYKKKSAVAHAISVRQKKKATKKPQTQIASVAQSKGKKDKKSFFARMREQLDSINLTNKIEPRKSVATAAVPKPARASVDRIAQSLKSSVHKQQQLSGIKKPLNLNPLIAIDAQGIVTIPKKKDMAITVWGHIALEAFFDTRQLADGKAIDVKITDGVPVVVDRKAARTIGVTGDAFPGEEVAGQIVLFPPPRLFDKNCDDVLDKGRFNMTAIEVNVKTDIVGPKVWNAKSFARIDADFTSVTENSIRSYRLKRGYMEFTWERTKLLCGHYYHPIAPDECYPNTLSNNFALFFDPFRYAPQIRLRHMLSDNWEFVAVAMKHNFRSLEARRSPVPGLFAQLHYKHKKSVMGFAIEYHQVIPRLITDKNCKTDASVTGLHPFMFAHLKYDPFTLKLRVIYSRNGQDFTMLGGYVAKSRDPLTDRREYEALQTLAIWSEWEWEFDNKQIGMFIGYTKNLGAGTRIQKSYKDEKGRDISLVTGFITNADYMFRLAPRMRFFVGPVTVGFEVEHTRAAFGKLNDRAEVVNPCPVGNTRFLGSIYYNF